MDGGIVNYTIPIIAATTSIIVATLGYIFAKHKEREADWRKKKLEMYHELFNGISATTDTPNNPESQRAFTKACNTIGLIASEEVIITLQNFRQEAKAEVDIERHDKALTDLLRAIRKDLQLPLNENSEFTYKLWASGIND